jgi:hypothetical protein
VSDLPDDEIDPETRDDGETTPAATLPEFAPPPLMTLGAASLWRQPLCSTD